MTIFFTVLGALAGLAALVVRPVAQIIEALDDPYFHEGNMQ